MSEASGDGAVTRRFGGRRRPPPGALVVEVEILVPFHDVDSLGVAWHGNYFKYFEIARTELERRMGLDIPLLHRMGFVAPVIESHCRYVSPMRFGDRGRCRAWVAGVDRKLTIAFDLFNETTGKRSAEGWTAQVALDRDSRELILEIPDEILSRVMAAAGDAGRGAGPG